MWNIKFDSGGPIPTKGNCELELKVSNKHEIIKFLIVAGIGGSVLGLKSCQALGLILKNIYYKRPRVDRDRESTPRLHTLFFQLQMYDL